MTEAAPALFRHCEAVYRAMEERAQVQPLLQTMEEEGLVYEGFLTHLFREMNLSVPYYTTVMQALQRMDCVRQIRRGGSTTPSRWLLKQYPTLELFNQMQDKTSMKVQGRRKVDKLEQMIHDLNRRLTSAEEILDALLQEHLEKLDAEERLTETSAPIETP